MGHTASKPPLLLHLPVDIILDICLVYLPPADALCLALTCKDIYTLAFARVLARFSEAWDTNKWRRASSADLQAFLSLLERDVAHYLSHCERCAKLHLVAAWSSSPSTSPFLFPWTVNHTPCPARRPGIAQPAGIRSTGFDADITTIFDLRAQARLRRQLTLQNLPWSLLWPWSPPSWQAQRAPGGQPIWVVDWEAKVTHPELLVSCTRKLNFHQTTLQSFRSVLGECHYPICRHVNVPMMVDNIIAMGEEAMHQSLKDGAGEDAAVKGAERSCRACLTDYIVFVWMPRMLLGGQESGEIEARWCHGWRFEVRTYHRLGGGTVGRDAGRVGMEVPQGRDMARFPEGSIALMWKADGKESTRLEGGRYREVVSAQRKH
ncbi:hypothetical protein B0T25DRAFT_459040 [Lasiosphaeria hispida]|uniref:F-box domain-containing protein n=1 Tax=Lasiosphaeria hispida TaxID=260671 RepID=A0AAJ0HES2_9PEZI|nr:hypothetical protein B0T25DRAFT_459040 [Lasiosphaeria hispida]